MLSTGLNCCCAAKVEDASECADTGGPDKSVVEVPLPEKPRGPRRSLLRTELTNIYSCLAPHKEVSSDWRVFDINLLEDPHAVPNLSDYFHLCIDDCTSALLVTLSCFALWNQHGKSNAFGKVIPAVRMEDGLRDKGVTRVIFFDDNLDVDGGLADSEGICNLRDIATGKFVEFAEGRNGFVRTEECGHTVVHYSTEYSSVLVKANILDAMVDEFYFTNLIKKYSEPDDRILLYMDVNSAIVCNDTAGGKSMASTLLSTMFEFMLIHPFEKREVRWKDRPVVKVEKAVSIKSIVKKMAKDLEGNYDRAFDKGFYDLDTCKQFLVMLFDHGEVRWAGKPGAVSLQDFGQAYQQYTDQIQEGALDDGITKSWFNCFSAIQSGCHTAVLNSFGVDTLAVVQKTVPDANQVVQVTVNFDLWGERDARSFVKQFAQPEH